MRKLIAALAVGAAFVGAGAVLERMERWRR
jgi:hypothetical protein